MKNFKIVIFGMLFSTISTILSLLLFSAVIMNNSIKDQYIPVVIVILFGLSLFIGTMITTRKIKEKGALYGMIISVLYISVMYLISSLVIGDYTITKQSLYMIICTVVIGSIGGITGVNIK